MQSKPSCPNCGKQLEPDAPQGLCQACLLEAGFPSGTATAGASARFIPPQLSELAPKFPQLDILEFIGQGGMGAVYKARQKQLDRQVALKILPPQAAKSPDFAERFTREARALAKLNHPRIVTLYEFGEADGLFYFLMEFVDGLNLRQVLKASPLAPKEALAIVPQICDALQYAHEHGIVHRDIKPENILLNRQGSVKIADFGVAKIVEPGGPAAAHPESSQSPDDLTQAGSTVGTPKYMAPEQLKNSAEVDHRADIYSLGVVLYQMLTNELPSSRVELPSRKVAIDVRLDEVVLRALEKEPERRYQQISEIREEVETIARTPAPAGTPSRVKNPRSSLLFNAAWAVVAVCALTALGIYLIRDRDSKVATEQPDPVPALAPQPQTSSTLTESNPPVAAPPSLLTVERSAILPMPAPLASAAEDDYRITAEVQDLIFNRKYEEALQRCLAFHEKSAKSVSFISLLDQWIELGRRYPKARQALIEIRDRQTREFAEGRGYFDLFMEVSHINRALQDEEATIELFKSIQADKQLARSCFPIVSSLLVEHQEYELCQRFVTDPQASLEQYRRDWQRLSQFEDLHKQRIQHQLQVVQGTNTRLAALPVPPGPPLLADKSFVDRTRQLIEILVATGRKAEAEAIRDEALATLDNARLRSSLADAEQRIQQPHPPGAPQ